jgi:hypothetical protein
MRGICLPTGNLFDFKPVRRCEWQETDDGRIVVLVPRFRGRLGQWLTPRLKDPCFRVKLDQLGSWVWLQCDGRQTVERIAVRFKEQFGGTLESASERLAVFVKRMLRADLITIHPGTSGDGH